MRTFTAASLVVCAGVLTCACTDTTSVPAHSATALSASLTHASNSRPPSYPNSQKYRDSGFHPATGRSGSAVVSVRSLLDKSGTTEVEVTTGTFDEGAAPGTLAKVQIKGFTPAGSHFFTDNHNDLLVGAATSFAYAGFARGMPLQVQTLVRSSDGTRTDVVTLNDNVRSRPDLVAASLEGPGQASLGSVVPLTGFVLESNGDLGARGDCVLYVDGVEVDRAAEIWVDAGGFVACAMTHRFTEPGDFALELRVENVRPGDFDGTNNSATASLLVNGPPPLESGFSTYSFQAWDIVDTTWYRSVSELVQWDGTVEKWDQTYMRNGPGQFASINGLIPRSLGSPITMQGEMKTNGMTINTLDVTLYPEWSDWQEGYCASSYAIGGPAAYVCVHTSGQLAGYTHVQYDWFRSEVVYHSESYVSYWDPSGVLHERWESADWQDIAGPIITIGSDFFGRLTVLGAGDATPSTAEATVPMEPDDLRFDYQDPGCLTVPVSVGCFEIHGRTVGRMGWVNYGSWPPLTP